MSPDTWQFLGTIAAAFIGFVGIWLSVRQTSRQSKTDQGQALFNELQEERAELKKDRAYLHAEVNALRVEVDQLRNANIELKDFVQELRNHIRRGLPPPPPPWPEGLH